MRPSSTDTGTVPFRAVVIKGTMVSLFSLSHVGSTILSVQAWRKSCWNAAESCRNAAEMTGTAKRNGSSCECIIKRYKAKLEMLVWGQVVFADEEMKQTRTLYTNSSRRGSLSWRTVLLQGRRGVHRGSAGHKPQYKEES